MNISLFSMKKNSVSNFFCWFLALSISMPVISVFSIRLEFLLSIFGFFLIIKNKSISYVSLMAFVCLFLFIIIGGFVSSSFFGEVQIRVLYCIYITLLVSSFSFSQIKSFSAGFLFGGIVLFFLLITDFLLNYNLMVINNPLYITKDYFLYYSDLLTIHVNTVGSIFLLMVFFSNEVYRKCNNLIFPIIYLSISLFLLSKKDIIISFIIFIYYFFDRNLIKSFMLVVILSFAALCFLLFSEFYVDLSNRDSIYISAFKAIIDNPFGFGFNTQQNIISKFSDGRQEFAAHNFILSMFLEGGVIPLLLFLLFLLFLFLNSNKIYYIYIFSFLFLGLLGNTMYFYPYFYTFVGVTSYSNLLRFNGRVS